MGSAVSATNKARQWLEEGALIIDVETTGLGNKAEIVEIGVINTDEDVLMDSLVKPESRIPAEVSKTHGITDKDVELSPPWPELHQDFCQLVKGERLVIFNASFDVRIIKQTAGRYGLRIPREVNSAECAMLAYADYWGEPGKLGDNAWQSLKKAVRQQQIEPKGTPHRALTDCFLTLGVIEAMAELY